MTVSDLHKITTHLMKAGLGDKFIIAEHDVIYFPGTKEDAEELMISFNEGYSSMYSFT